MGSYGGKPAVLILMLVTLGDKLFDEILKKFKSKPEHYFYLLFFFTS
jgi:hypothetical protein